MRLPTALSSRVSRLTAVVASAALVFGSIFVAAPAYADEPSASPSDAITGEVSTGGGELVEEEASGLPEDEEAVDGLVGEDSGEASDGASGEDADLAGDSVEEASDERASADEVTADDAPGEGGQAESETDPEPAAQLESESDTVSDDAPVAMPFRSFAARTMVDSTAGSVIAGNVLDGAATWGISAYLGAANFGRPNPLPTEYTAPASFDETTRTASWRDAIGTVEADGSASIAVSGTSVNFAKTGGGWLRIGDLEIEIDPAGNGVVTAVVSYGTSTVGTPPAMVFDPEQAPDRGPTRLPIVSLTGNSVAPTVDGNDRSWTGLAGVWHGDFLAFLGGDGADIPAWSYASAINNADRGPSPISLAVSLIPAPTHDARTYNSGGATWGMSSYLSSMNFGRPNPLPTAYGAPASFDAEAGLATWGGGRGSVASDGSATLAFEGTSVNFAKTGGGWLRLSDIEAALDGSGNGTVSAIVEYGTSTTGRPPAMVYEPTQPAAHGPERVTIVTLEGNAAPPVQDGDTATWNGLAGTWSDDFLAFLQGDGVDVPAWTYASTLNNVDEDRLPSAFTFQLGIVPVADAVEYDLGSATWGMSTYLSSMNFGRPNPLPDAYTAPASFDVATGLATWGAGSGAVESDGSATLAFKGTSVNFAKTGGGWLRLSDVEAQLDAGGNGIVTAIVEYGTSRSGRPPAMEYQPEQAGTRGPDRLPIVVLAGNDSPVAQDGDTATWTGLTGTWHDDFLAFLAGDGADIPAWTYASTLSNEAVDRSPSTFSFELGVRPPATPTATTLVVSPSTTVATGTALTFTATVAPATQGSVEFRSGSSILATAVLTGGAATVTSTLPQGTHSVTAHFVPADALVDAPSQSSPVAIEILAPPPTVAGSLNWGIKSSFASYVTGPIAHGSITTSGVGTAGGAYQFGQAGSSSLDPSGGTGSVRYSGSVHFSGHGGALELTIANPSITVHSATDATLYVTANGGRVALATLALGSGTRTEYGWAGVPATLTAAGSAAFDGRYAAGEGLDPVTFVVGSESGPLGGTTTVAATPERTPAATPPATTGIQLLSGPRPAAGDEVTITASGFEPNEQGILVVIYSTPVVLGTTNADANGDVRWTGKLPKGLSGKHTLTLQGSVDRGLEIEIAAAQPRAVKGCAVDGASLDWGFKEAWRSYVSGTIANGKWEVAGGATYETPLFSWQGSGTVDPTALTGLLEFAGSVRFTGHDGLLDTTMIDPRIELDGDTAALIVDIDGVNRSGETVMQQDVVLAELDLTAAETSIEDGVLTIAGIPAVLTADGGTAFSYPAGEVLDPITVVVELGAACEAATSGPVATAAPAEVEPISAGPDLTWLWWLIGALVVIAAVIVTVILVRRRS